MSSALTCSMNSLTSAQSGDESGSFHQPAYAVRKARRKEKLRQQIITGTKKDNNNRFRGAPEVDRDIFIYRVHPDTMEADIEALIAAEGNEFRSLSCVSNPNAKYKSFRLTVPISQYSKIYSDEFPWPEGVMVRKYIPPRGQGFTR